MLLLLAFVAGASAAVKCGGGIPLTDPGGVQLFCGAGGVVCPAGSYCDNNIDAIGHYAVCCPGVAPLLSTLPSISTLPTVPLYPSSTVASLSASSLIYNQCPFGLPMTSFGSELMCGVGFLACPLGSYCVIDRCCPIQTTSSIMPISSILPASSSIISIAPTVPSICPNGLSVASCPINYCLNALCPGVPGASCMLDYCGGCGVLWFGPDGNTLLSAQQCAWGVPALPNVNFQLSSQSQLGNLQVGAQSLQQCPPPPSCALPTNMVDNMDFGGQSQGSFNNQNGQSNNNQNGQVNSQSNSQSGGKGQFGNNQNNQGQNQNNNSSNQNGQSNSQNGQSNSQNGQSNSQNGQSSSQNGQSNNQNGQSNNQNGQANNQNGQSNQNNQNNSSNSQQSSQSQGNQQSSQSAQFQAGQFSASGSNSQSNQSSQSSSQSQSSSSNQNGQSNSQNGQSNSQNGQSNSQNGQSNSQNGQSSSQNGQSNSQSNNQNGKANQQFGKANRNQNQAQNNNQNNNNQSNSQNANNQNGQSSSQNGQSNQSGQNGQFGQSNNQNGQSNNQNSQSNNQNNANAQNSQQDVWHPQPVPTQCHYENPINDANGCLSSCGTMVCMGPVRFLELQAGSNGALATWVPPLSAPVGLTYTAQFSYDGQNWTSLPLETPQSTFVRFPVNLNKPFVFRVTPLGFPTAIQVYQVQGGNGKQR